MRTWDRNKVVKYRIAIHLSRRTLRFHKLFPVAMKVWKTWGLLLHDDNKIKMARKPGKKQKENRVGCIGEGKRWKGNIGEGMTGTIFELSLEVTLCESKARTLKQSTPETNGPNWEQTTRGNPLLFQAASTIKQLWW